MKSGKIRQTILGKPRDPADAGVFHKLSLVAFFAWVGLGADGLSSSCYGPEEAFLALGRHGSLGLFVALGSALTVLLISASYAQIIELFPSGGGGYLVASKLLSKEAGVVSGCALLIDYVLTISISIAAGADAVFSLLPAEWQAYKLTCAGAGLLLLTILNLRGIRESVVPMVPIFLIFVLTHFFAIIYALVSDQSQLSALASTTQADVRSAWAELGTGGVILLILRAYSMGAGTFTGIEAVSNGLPILREPKVKTGKKTMLYMSLSLAFTAAGLMVAYLLFQVAPETGKTLNAVLFEKMSQAWGPWGRVFVYFTLFSAAALLFIAAQAGFLDGPRVLSNMALDRWMPSKFSLLNDRLVTQNGILVMGAAAAGTLILTRGSVRYLVVLYSINVFITFCLSQLGMVRHWWNVRGKARRWRWKLTVNGLGLLATVFILASVLLLKFREGGWITLLLTGSLVAAAFLIKRHYAATTRQLGRLDALLVQVAGSELAAGLGPKAPDGKAKTAVLFVNGFNGLGLHTLFNVLRFFGNEFRNFVFVGIGIVDAGNFKGAEDVEALRDSTREAVDRYARFMAGKGYYAEGISAMGIDVIGEAEGLIPQLLERFPGAVFFGGQLVFSKETLWTRWLHNHTIFSLQRSFYEKGIPFVILPIRV